MHGESEGGSELQEIIGESPVLKSVLRQAIEAAKSDSIVLITGEVGTGKELIARAIHRMGSRRTQSFVKIDCTNVPPAQLEAALLGPDRGRLERANLGTLLLSHVENVSQELHPRLLRAFEQKFLEHPQSEMTVPVDARLIATSSANGQMIEIPGSVKVCLLSSNCQSSICQPCGSARVIFRSWRRTSSGSGHG